MKQEEVHIKRAHHIDTHDAISVVCCACVCVGVGGWGGHTHSPLRISRQILPSLSMLGWYIFVMNRTLGGAMGYSSGRNSSRLKVPFSKGDYGG